MKNIIFVTIDYPLPANSGHKVEQVNRFIALKEKGYRLTLITWRSKGDGGTVLRDQQNLFERVDVFDINHTLASFARRVARLPWQPSHVSSRELSANQMRNLLGMLEDFSPDFVVADGIYGGEVVKSISNHFGIKKILRSHNVEHKYFRQQYKAARSLRDRVAWGLACIGLRRYEFELMKSVDWVFDISVDDMQFWKSKGVQNISWLPPIHRHRGGETKIIDFAKRKWDLGYVGNLRLPNNYKGLAWFLDAVFPLILEKRPQFKLCIGGSNPTRDVFDLLSRYESVDFMPDLPEASTVLGNCRVLMNPILSGSGVNIKAIDMLFYPAHLISTTLGVRGFNEASVRQFSVADNPSDFASEVIRLAEVDYLVTEERLMAQSFFEVEAAESFVAKLAEL